MRHNVTMKVHLHLGPSPGLYVTMVMLLYYKQHDKFHFPPFARLDCRALRCSVFKISFRTLLLCSVAQSEGQRQASLFCWLLIFKIGFLLFSFCHQIRAEKKVKFWHRLIN